MTIPPWLTGRRIAAGLGLLVLVVLINLVIQLPGLLRPLLNQWLPQTLHWLNGTEVKLDIDRLAWDSLHIRSASTHLDDGTRIELEDLQLDFAPFWQPQDSSQRQLRIGQLHITLTASSNQKAASAARQAGEQARQALDSVLEHPQQTPIELPRLSDWLQLPLARIDIDQLRIRHPWFEASLGSELNNERWRLHGELQLDGVAAPWQLELNLQQSGQLLAQISDQQTLLLQFYADIQQDARNTRISIQKQLEVAALQQRLLQTPPPWLSIPADLPLISPQLSTKAELSLPNSAYLPGDLEITSSSRIPLQKTRLQAGLTLEPGQLNINIQHQPGAEWQLQLQSPRLGLQFSNPDQPAAALQIPDLLWQARCDNDLQQCQLDHKGKLRWQQGQTRLELTPVLKAQWQDNGLTLQSRPTFNYQDGNGSAKGNAVVALHWQADETRVQVEQLQGRWQASEALKTSSGWQLQPLDLTLTQPLDMVLIPHPQLGWRLHANTLQLTSAPLLISQGRSKIQLGGGSFSCQPDLKAPACQIDLRLRASRFEQWPVPAGRISGPIRVDLDQQQLHADLNIQAAGQQLQLRTRIQHQLDSGIGSAQWHLDRLNMSWSALGISEMENLTGVQLLSGQMSGQGWLEWHADGQIEPDMMLRGDHVSLIWNNSVTAEDWDFLLALREPPDNHGGGYLADAQLSGRSLNNGVNFSDLLARAQLQLPADLSWFRLDLQEVHTDVLGGRIHIPQAIYDSRNEVNAFAVSLDNLQLAQMAALEPSAEVQANGILDGQLPVIITSAGPMVPDGQLAARAPGGTIRYHNDTSISLKNADPTVGLAMQALENFRFRELGTSINYLPDGNLHLGMRFQGHNPDFFGGQSTNLNINLDYNLLDLLESLRVADDIISRVEQQYGQ